MLLLLLLSRLVVSDSVRPQRQQPTRFPCPWDSPGKNTGVAFPSGILLARTLEWHFFLHCMKVKSESEVAQLRPTLSDPMDTAFQSPPSMGFSRQEHWSGVPLPSLVCGWKTTKFSYLLLHSTYCDTLFWLKYMGKIWLHTLM